MKLKLLLVFLCILIVGCSWEGGIITEKKYYPEFTAHNDCYIIIYPTIICEDRTFPEHYMFRVRKYGMEEPFYVTPKTYFSYEVGEVYKGEVK